MRTAIAPIVFAAFVTLIVAKVHAPLKAAPPPSGPAAVPPAPDLSTCSIPSDAYPPNGTNLNPEPFFNYYAWQAFMALVCTAREGARGVAAVPHSHGGVPVFETYKSAWETFPSRTMFPSQPPVPVDWDHYAGKDFNPCREQPEDGSLTLGSFSESTDVAQPGQSAALAPIVGQNSKYVHYLTQFNDVAFNAIRDRSYYLASTAAKGADFPEGSIFLKSAWIETAGLPPDLVGKYHVVKARVKDPVDGTCRTADLALLALHIVQKTPTRHARIWATFENRYNVPLKSDLQHNFTFFDPGASPPAMPETNPLEGKPLVEHPAPFNIQRKEPSTGRAQTSDDTFHKAITAALGADSKWLNYGLVMVQWPGDSSANKLTPGCDTTPGCGSMWAWANPVMETFFQNDSKTGTCIGCHQLSNSDGPPADFAWSLRIESYPDGADLRTKTLSRMEWILSQQRKVARK